MATIEMPVANLNFFLDDKSIKENEERRKGLLPRQPPNRKCLELLQNNSSNNSSLENEYNYLQIFDQYFSRAQELLTPSPSSSPISGPCITQVSLKSNFNQINNTHFSQPYQQLANKCLSVNQQTMKTNHRKPLKRQERVYEDEEEESEEERKKGERGKNEEIFDETFFFSEEGIEGKKITLKDERREKNIKTNKTNTKPCLIEQIGCHDDHHLTKSNLKTNSKRTNVFIKNQEEFKTRRTSAPVQRPPHLPFPKSPSNKKKKRSQSFKYHKNPQPSDGRSPPQTPTKQRRARTNFDDLYSRRHNLFFLPHHPPNPGDPVEKKLQLVKLMQGLDCRVVRTFVTSSKGLVHRGDSFKKKSEATPDIVRSSFLPPSCEENEIFFGGKRKNSLDLLATNISSFIKQQMPHQTPQPPHKSHQSFSVWPYVCNVMVLGEHGVGKSALLQQFITSEFMGNSDPQFDKEFEKTLSVQLDDQETTLTFTDLPTQIQKKGIQYADIDAYIVCYSITDRHSFEFSVDLLREFRQRSDAAIILVANKSDLVRSRKVAFEEGRSVCQKYNCKFIEVSAAFNHRVEDLLVGLVHQIRLNPSRQRAKSVPNTTNLSTDPLISPKTFSSGCFKGAKEFLSEIIFGFRKAKSRSCDNLWTL